ncbi:universal stress protein [Natronobiforma cellulositropha]|uniref:universal stress protein n=1 Tax=Natronobiforma cellulositropha TaxID=1679076 RepID=UPI0021D59BE3|nr:universal stress protein [Natronobiforma cellulositropha]
MVLFQHVLVPVATGDDADATCDALVPYIDDIERVTAVHVIEKAGGGIDKAPLEKRQEDAAACLERFASRLGGREDIELDTWTAYGTDVVETLFEAVADAEADAIVFRARGGSRLVRLLAGDVSTRLITEPPVPAVSLPRAE